jgi:hypothetical protein
MRTLAAITDGTASIAHPPPVATPLSASTLGLGRTSLIRTIGGRLEDALLLLLGVFVLPFGILLIGTPIALCVRLVLEIARRL